VSFGPTTQIKTFSVTA